MDKFLNRACALYLICWTFFPFMQVGTIYRLAAVLCAGLWVVSAVFHRPDFINENLIFIMVSSATILLMVFWRMFLGIGIADAFLQTFQFIIMILIGLISVYYYKHDRDFSKTIFAIILLAIIVFCITTIHGTVTNPYATRIANSEWLEERFEGNEMVGLYGYVYMCVFIAPMLLYLIQKKITLGKYIDVLIRLAWIAIIVMVVCAGYMIAIFCTLGSCLAVWTFSSKSNLKKCVVFLLFLLFVINYKTIVDAVFTVLMRAFEDNPVYYTKFRDFRLLFLNGEATGETVDGRFSNYAQSWANVVNHPMVGCYFHGKSGGGGHSAILDVIGRFGIGTALLYLYTVLIVPHRMVGKARKWNILDYTLLIMSVVFGLLDPFFQELSIAIYFVFPFVLLAVKERESKDWVKNRERKF